MPITAATLGTAALGQFNSSLYSDTYNLGANGAAVAMVAFQLQRGDTLQIDTDDFDLNGDAYVRIFDGFGNEVKADGDGRGPAEGGSDNAFDVFTRFTANYDSRYTIAISYASLTDYDPTTSVGRGSAANTPFTVAGTLNVRVDSPTFFPGAPSINAITDPFGAGIGAFFIEDDDRSIRWESREDYQLLFSGEIDIARFELQQNDRLVIDVNGALNPANVFDTRLRVFNAGGVQIASDDDSGSGFDSEAVVFAAATGNYYIGISEFANGAYNPIDGSGTVASDGGSYQVILHLNPTLLGSSAIADSIAGTNDNDYVVTLAGNDTLIGNDGFDTLSGGDDQDSLSGGRGEDALYGDTGNDTIDGGLDSDVVNGGTGDDSLSGGGGNGADYLEGGFGADTLLGLNGRDTLIGGYDDDSLVGGVGNDLLQAFVGADTMDGGAGNDVLVAGGDEADNLMLGGSGNDRLTGDRGNDTLNGGSDNDTLDGGSDDDLLIGGLGDDELNAQRGDDTMTGGEGADTFGFLGFVGGLGVDEVTDFEVGIDRIDLSDVISNPVTLGNIDEYIETADLGGGVAILRVAPSGTGNGDFFRDLATFNGVSAAALDDFANFLF